jgi:hypothetical protein
MKGGSAKRANVRSYSSSRSGKVEFLPYRMRKGVSGGPKGEQRKRGRKRKKKRRRTGNPLHLLLLKLVRASNVDEAADVRVRVERIHVLLRLAVVSDLGEFDGKRVGAVAGLLEDVFGVADDVDEVVASFTGGFTCKRGNVSFGRGKMAEEVTYRR